jgi:hypothetical protein
MTLEKSINVGITGEIGVHRKVAKTLAKISC